MENLDYIGKQWPADEKMFKQYPSPIWESGMKLHSTLINHTTPFFGPIMYWLIRAIGAHTVVEIGVAQGYTSWWMASAIKDNNQRYKMKGKYIAIDIGDKNWIFDPMIKKQGLPIEFWQMDSADLTEKSFAPNSLDLVFQDGWHATKHCLRELEILYPALKDKGNGYIAMHDIHSWCEEYFNIVRKTKQYNFNYITFLNNYGLAICQRMDNFDYDFVRWPDGPQPEMVKPST